MTQRRRLRLLFVTILLMSALVWIPAAFASTRSQAFSASLTPVAGTVQYLPAGRTQWLNVTQITLINEGDQIRTADDGFARLSVVTGIEVEIYPTTWVTLNDLSLGAAGDDALAFSLGQVVGGTFVSVNQTLDPNDRVEVLTPGGSASVRGTQYFTLITPDLHISIVPQQDEVTVTTIDGSSVVVDPDSLARLIVDIDPPPAVCTREFLLENTTVVSLFEIIDEDTEIAELREFLRDELTRNVNPEVRTFLRAVTGLDPLDIIGLSDDEDQAELQELLQRLEDYDAAGTDLPQLLSDFRAFFASYNRFLAGNAGVAPATCGNGSQDPGEDAKNCALDFVDVAPSCGNDLCETERKELGESLINCPEDCLPPGSIAQSCIAVIDEELNPEATPTRVGSGVGR